MKYNFMSGILYNDSSDFSGLVSQTTSKIIFILLIPSISNSTCIQGELSCTFFIMIFVVMSAQVCLYSNYILTYILAGVFRFPTREFKTSEKILESSLQISR
jgi:hypothetical protein